MTREGASGKLAKSKVAMVHAFGQLLMEKRFSQIHVSDVMRKANVGRSTFYDHFANTRDLLRQTMQGILGCFAKAIRDDANPAEMEFAVEHVLDNRVMATDLLNGDASRFAVEVLADQVLNAWPAEPEDSAPNSQEPSGQSVSRELVAKQIAESQLGLLRAWLAMPESATASQIAEQICSTTRAIRDTA